MQAAPQILKCKDGLWGVFIYIIVVFVVGVLIQRVLDQPYPSTQSLMQFWYVQLMLSAICVYYIRYFGPQQVGFGTVYLPGLVWMFPAYAVLSTMFIDLYDALRAFDIGPNERKTLGLFALVSIFVAFSEEVMFRGVLLRAALRRLPVSYAMLVSAAAFSFLHGLSGFGGPVNLGLVQQMAFTFVVGLFLAPLAVKLGNLWPLIIWHSLWDFALLSSHMLGLLHPFALVGMLVQAVIGVWLWAEVVRS